MRGITKRERRRNWELDEEGGDAAGKESEEAKEEWTSHELQERGNGGEGELRGKTRKEGRRANGE